MNSRKTLTCNIFQLPQDIFRVIFQYLSVEDLMKGEEAFLNNQELLSLYRLSLEGITLTEKIKIEDGREMLISWIIDHKLLVEKLELCHLRDLGMNLLNQSRSSLKLIDFNSPDAETVFPPLGNFPSLTSVRFEDSHYFTKDKLLSFFSQNPQLEIVEIDYMHHLSNEIILHLSNSCPNIKTLNLHWNDWVNDETISLLSEQGLFPHLKSLDIQETSVRNQDSLRQLILSRPLFSGLSLPYDIEYSNDFLIFYLRQVIFPSILSQNNSNDVESHSLALSSLISGGRGMLGKFQFSTPALVYNSFSPWSGKRYDLVTPELFTVDILSHLYRKDCSLETLDHSTQFFDYLSNFPSMIDSILQSQFIPFIIDSMSTYRFLSIGPVVNLLFHCGVFHDYFPLFVEKYRTHPNTLIKIFYQAIEFHFISLKKKELQTIIPIVLNQLRNRDSSNNCLRILSKLLQKLSSQNLIDPNHLLLSLKSIDVIPESTDNVLLDCLVIFISVKENYQQLLIESNLIPQIMTMVRPEHLIHFTTRCLSSQYELLVDHLMNLGVVQYLVTKYSQFTVQDKNKMKTLVKLFITTNNKKYSEIVNEMKLPDELKSKLYQKEKTKKSTNKVKK